MIKQAFLTGYTGRPTRTPAQLLQLAINLDAIVVDSRYSPQSRVPHWSGTSLKHFLRSRYMWLQAFGNSAYKSGFVSLVNPWGGLLLLDKIVPHRFIILCACADGEMCHRRQVGQFLTVNGWGVREVTAEEWKEAGHP